MLHFQRFSDVMLHFHLIWSAPLQIGLAIYFLWQILGASSLAGLAIMILMITCQVESTRVITRLAIRLDI